MPISQYVLQFPQEMHIPGFTSIRKRPTFCIHPRTAAIGQKLRHHTRGPNTG